jgi:hypothetical protein
VIGTAAKAEIDRTDPGYCRSTAETQGRRPRPSLGNAKVLESDIRREPLSHLRSSELA